MEQRRVVLRRILLVGGGLLASWGVASSPAWLGPLPAVVPGIVKVLTAALGGASAPWLLEAAEAVTGSRFRLSVLAGLLLRGYGAALAAVALPLGLVLLSAQYARSRRGSA